MARKQSSSSQQQKPPPKRRSTSDGTKTTTTTTGSKGTGTGGTKKSQHYYWKTIIRESITPFLPPPVTKAIYKFDKTYLIQFGPEASITIGSTCMIGFLVWIIIIVKGRQLLFGTTTSSKSNRRALLDDDTLDNITNTKFLDTSTTTDGTELPCKATVVLCGPVYAGKTRMFYQLCNYGSNPNNNTMYSNIPTLSSIKVNVGTGIDSIALTETNNSTNNDNTSSNKQTNRIEYIRYVDWPGRATLDDINFVSVITEEATITLRIIFVIDSSKPINICAQVFYELLDIIHQRYQKYQYQYQKQQSSKTKKENDNDNNLLTILIACHKKDLLKSKNHRRIKIQMRTELEKLLSIQYKTIETDTNQKEHHNQQQQLQQQSKNTTTTTTSTKQPWWQQGKVLDLDNLQFCKLRFISTTCCTNDDKGMNELARYCSNGL